MSLRAMDIRWPARTPTASVDLDGKTKRVSGPTRALAESRRDDLVAALGRRRSPATSRFSITTTVQKLSDWWLESVTRHQVRESSLATYRKSVAYLVDEFGHARVSSTSGRRCRPGGSRRCWIGLLRTPR